MANMPLGGAVYRSANLPTENTLVSQTEAASQLNVSERSVRSAVKVPKRVTKLFDGNFGGNSEITCVQSSEFAMLAAKD